MASPGPRYRTPLHAREEPIETDELRNSIAPSNDSIFLNSGTRGITIQLDMFAKLPVDEFQLKDPVLGKRSRTLAGRNIACSLRHPTLQYSHFDGGPTRAVKLE